MNALLAIASLALGFCVSFLVPTYGAGAVFLCAALAAAGGYVVSRIEGEGKFLLQLFVAALLARVLVGSLIFAFELQDFFGGDAYTYDILGYYLMKSWEGENFYKSAFYGRDVGWGMTYVVAAVYMLLGRNMLAVQFVNGVLGAATAPVIFLCARLIFGNRKVAVVAAVFVAFYPSLVLWSAQGLKDGPLVFLLALGMLATLKLLEQLRPGPAVLLGVSLLGVLSLRFYICYMMVAAIGLSFVIGLTRLTAQTFVRQFVIIVGLALVVAQFSSLDPATRNIDTITLERIQTSRADLAASAQSGFGKDVDVSTTSGALTTIPVGMIYLLFAPFPWQLASLRQSITLPEMLVWWGSFPLLVMGLWFTLKHRMRQALPILIFTTMLTLSYSVFQGNVGTAYRQ
ncbi:MAG TPA: glycosyltransferase family 39 protein, partial [Pyrinomonadaceae bacterium]|nr:glycosyltransferase family 39 protein [Pyrinomonadaceae bacterium]